MEADGGRGGDVNHPDLKRLLKLLLFQDAEVCFYPCKVQAASWHLAYCPPFQWQFHRNTEQTWSSEFWIFTPQQGPALTVTLCSGSRKWEVYSEVNSPAMMPSCKNRYQSRTLVIWDAVKGVKLIIFWCQCFRTTIIISIKLQGTRRLQVFCSFYFHEERTRSTATLTTQLQICLAKTSSRSWAQERQVFH